MSDTYNYANGAVHHDHHRSITINGANAGDLQALLKAFMYEEAADAVAEEVTTEVAAPAPKLTDALLVRAVEATQAFFWAQSSWAVVYCVCRDYMGIANNVSEFERRVAELPLRSNVYECRFRTIQKTLDTNEFMAYPVASWERHGAKERAVLLAERLMKEFKVAS